MVVIALISMKGGVGKTTITLGLASAGWRRGDRVLVIDADPQANASMALGLDPRVVQAADGPVPSTWGDGVRVGTRPEASDVVLIDAPPSLGQDARQALAMADAAVIVTEPGFFTLQGALRSLDAVTSVRRSRNAGLGTPTIVLNRLRTTVPEHVHADLRLRAVYGGLVNATVVPERLAIQQTQALRQPIHAWDSPAGRELSRIFDGIYDGLVLGNPPADEHHP